MKTLGFIFLLTFSQSVLAGLTCDLSVELQPYEGGVRNIEEYEAYVSSSETLQFDTVALERAIAKCKADGAIECKRIGSQIKERSTFSGPGMKIIVQGIKITGAKKLSDAQMAKKRKTILCQNINDCITAAVNDESASANYLQKLYIAKENSGCPEIENFIFSN